MQLSDMPFYNLSEEEKVQLKNGSMLSVFNKKDDRISYFLCDPETGRRSRIVVSFRLYDDYILVDSSYMGQKEISKDSKAVEEIIDFLDEKNSENF